MNGRLLVFLLLFLSALSMFESVRIGAKAMMAQRLIERAWTRALAGDDEHRPWHWADTWPVARLRTSALTRDLFVLAGVNGGALAFGPGHYSHTSMPGEPGASVIAGHRDTHFRFLEKLGENDVIEVQDRAGRWLAYRVREKRVVDTRLSAVWTVPTDSDELHLITCYPFDAVAPGGPLRMVVMAERTSSG